MKDLAHARQNGQILVALILTIPFFMLILAAYLNFSSSSFRVAKQDQFFTSAQLAADAGADYAVEQINQNPAWTGTAADVALHQDSTMKTSFGVTVVNNSASSKTMTITGKTYWPLTATSPSSTVKIAVSLEAITSGSFSVASGEGGLIMSNSSKITGGNVLVNGTINLSNTAQIGLSTNTVTVQVADAVCPVPVDSTYPRICTASDHQPQPISISNSAKIYGSVSANNQTSGAGMSSPGLVSSSGVSTESLPTYDRTSQKAAVTTTLTSAAASCSSGSHTLAANTKITGDLLVSNKCQLTINGNIWVTGALNVSNSAQLIVANSAGTTKPVIMVDGNGGAVFKNGSTLVPNASGTGFEVITFYSTAACSPDCASVTGTDLNNSRSIVTIALSNSSSAANTVFYAYWTEVSVNNTGQIGALIGQTINLSNQGTITFTTSTGAGTTSWIINGYRRAY